MRVITLVGGVKGEDLKRAIEAAREQGAQAYLDPIIINGHDPRITVTTVHLMDWWEDRPVDVDDELDMIDCWLYWPEPGWLP